MEAFFSRNHNKNQKPKIDRTSWGEYQSPDGYKISYPPTWQKTQDTQNTTTITNFIPEESARKGAPNQVSLSTVVGKIDIYITSKPKTDLGSDKYIISQYPLDQYKIIKSNVKIKNNHILTKYTITKEKEHFEIVLINKENKLLEIKCSVVSPEFDNILYTLDINSL